jgi:hypothetical protein
MATIWITYAWKDNENQDVDFVAQELKGAGLTVKLDRWNIGAGKRLWEQIEGFIKNPSENDAWVLIATTNSLESEPCKEEFAYALDRALSTRGAQYPVIGLFLGPVDNSLIPLGIKTRLYVSVSDLDWKERIVAAAEGRAPSVSAPTVSPFYLKVHKNPPGHKPLAIEVRPRAGVWAPLVAAIPFDEKDRVDPDIMVGPRDVPTNTGLLLGGVWESGGGGKVWGVSAGNQATPNDSFYIWCKELPSRLLLGVDGRSPQYRVQFNLTSGEWSLIS